jgi:hypothetical protein
MDLEPVVDEMGDPQLTAVNRFVRPPPAEADIAPGSPGPAVEVVVVEPLQRPLLRFPQKYHWDSKRFTRTN